MVKFLLYSVDFSLIFQLITLTLHFVVLTSLAESNEDDSNSSTTINRIYNEKCPDHNECSKLGGGCINCTCKSDCVYGENVTVPCNVNDGLRCAGNRTFERSMICRFCYQTDNWEHTCVPVSSYTNCKAVSSPRERFLTNCTVRSDIICLGNRHFLKNQTCNWTSGYKWSTALALSITLGGFGADRFYLGHWQEGIGKLFSFGGLGVWTLIDVILITIGYLGPADGSLYIR